MYRPLIAAALAALLFYGILPIAGAFGARGRWRTFRRDLIAASGAPRVGLGIALASPSSTPGLFQHYGAVEAIQGQDFIWTRGAGITATVSLKNARIYLLPAARPLDANGSYDFEAADESLKITPWKSLSGLEEGARLYAAGKLRIEGGLPILYGTQKEPLLVLIHDGRDEDLLRRALWAGRHRNEYWNSITMASLAAGFLATGSALYTVLHPPILSLPVALVTALTLIPILPLLPPGSLFLAVYRRLWAKARHLRANRDLLGSFDSLGMPQKTPTASTLALIEDCVRKARVNEILAGLSFLTALVLNFFCIVIVIRTLI